MMLAELFVCEPKQCHACQPRKAQMSGAKIQTRMTDRHRALREAQMAQRMTKKQVPDGVRSMSESALVGAPSVESPTSLMSMSRVAPSVTESFVGPNGEAPTSVFESFERRVERVGAAGHQLCVQARSCRSCAFH